MNSTNCASNNRLISRLRRLSTEKGYKVSVDRKGKTVSVIEGTGYREVAIVTVRWGTMNMTEPRALRAAEAFVWSL